MKKNFRSNHTIYSDVNAYVKITPEDVNSQFADWLFNSTEDFKSSNKRYWLLTVTSRKKSAKKLKTR